MIISVMNKGETKNGEDVELIAALILTAPESPIRKKEVLCLFEQVSVGRVVEVAGLLEGGEILVDEINFFVGLVRSGVNGDGRMVGVVGDGGELDTEGPNYGAVVSATG